MEAQARESKMGSRKIPVALCVLAAIGGVALFEWDMTPGSGRYKAGGQSAGPGPAALSRHARVATQHRLSVYAQRGAKAPPRRRALGDLSAVDGQGRLHRAGAPPRAARCQRRLPRRLDHRMHVRGAREPLSASGRHQARAGARAQGQRHQRRPVGQQQHAFAAAAAGQGRAAAAGLRRAHAWHQRYRHADGQRNLLDQGRLAAPLRGGKVIRRRCRQGARQVAHSLHDGAAAARRQGCARAGAHRPRPGANAGTGRRRRIGGRRSGATSRARSGPSCGSRPPGASRRCS